MVKSELNNELFDVLIKHAVKDYLEEEYLDDMQKYQRLPEPSYDSDFLTCINRIKTKVKRDHRLGLLKKTIPKAAVIIAVSLAILSGTVMSVEAWRVRILNLLFNKKDDHIEITLSEDHSGEFAKIQSHQYYFPSYLPEGFTVLSSEKVGRTLVIDIADKDGQKITFEQYAESNVSFLVNTEGKSAEEVKLSGGIGYCTQDEDSVTLLWNQGEYSFILLTTLDKKEAVKIANSMEWIITKK